MKKSELMYIKNELERAADAALELCYKLSPEDRDSLFTLIKDEMLRLKKISIEQTEISLEQSNENLQYSQQTLDAIEKIKV